MIYLSWIVGVLAVAGRAYADTGGGVGEPWYKIVGQIIATLLAAVTLLATLASMGKMKLESRRLELEISQKQRELTGATNAPSVVAELLPPIGDAHRALVLLLRFVLLELAITLWKVVPAAIGYITKPLPYVLYLTLGDKFIASFSPTSPMTLTLLGISTLVGLMLDLAYWVIVFGLGWPLLKDTCAFLGIPLTAILDVPILRRWRPGRQAPA